MSTVHARPTRDAFRPSTASLLGDFACRWLVRVLLLLGAVFLALPLIAVVIAAFNAPPVMMFPPAQFSLESFRQIPPTWYDAFFTSIELACLAAAIGMLITVPAAFALVRGRLPGRGAIELLFRSPLQVPQIVLSVSIYQYYVVLQDLMGGNFIGGFTGLLIAHTLLVSPYILSTMLARIGSINPSIEEASEGLGARPARTFFRVTLPLVRPALTAALILAFVISFDNVTLSLFLSADSSASTLPVTLFSAIELSASPVIFAAAALTILLSVFITFSIEKLIGLRATLAR
jgi:putative spermidine/putrescine transport system permease protein